MSVHRHHRRNPVIGAVVVTLMLVITTLAIAFGDLVKYPYYVIVFVAYVAFIVGMYRYIVSFFDYLVCRFYISCEEDE